MSVNPLQAFCTEKITKCPSIFTSIILLRADALAPEKDSEFVRKYRQIWKAIPELDKNRKWQAQTPNGQFCVIAALPSFENICYFCTLVARRKVCGSRHLAKPQKRCMQWRTKSSLKVKFSEL
jgi:hypothetical protein